jgi:hypothetical protein
VTPVAVSLFFLGLVANAADGGPPPAGSPADAGVPLDAAGPPLAPGPLSGTAAPPAPPPPPPAPARVETVLLRGVVLARGSRDPVVQASILVDAVGLAETDEQGRFAVEVTAGRHRLQVQAPGFDPADVPVELRPGSPEAALTVRLMPRLSGERYETVVTPPALAAVELAQNDLTRTAGSMGEPFRVIESLPGVTQVAWPLSLYAIRGANPGNTGFFLDGVRLPALFHFALVPPSSIPTFSSAWSFTRAATRRSTGGSSRAW